jgi:hypothetical protein
MKLQLSDLLEGLLIVVAAGLGLLVLAVLILVLTSGRR